MVKHVILWKLKEEYDDLKKRQIKQNAAKALEGLSGKIPGLADISVMTEGLPTSTADMMLDSTFESAEALRAYSVHPAHVAAADAFVRPYIAVRSCFDFEI